jgi:hypothetical protein
VSTACVTIAERIIAGHVRLGSGVVRVVGPEGCGKTTALLRVLHPDRHGVKRHRSETPSKAVAYVSVDTCQDVKELAARVLAEIGSADPSTTPTSTGAGEALARAAAAVGDEKRLFHLVLDHVGGTADDLSATDVGVFAAECFASSRWCHQLIVWVVARRDMHVAHATRLAMLPAADVKDSLATTLAHTRNTTLAAAHRAVAAYVTGSRPLNASVSLSDPRRAAATVEALCGSMSETERNDIAAHGAAPHAVGIIQAFGTTHVGPVSASKADSGLPTSAKVLTVAVYLCGALTPHQLAAALGADAAARRSATRRSAGDKTVAKAATPHTITTRALAHAYDNLARMHAIATGDERLPPAAAALHHLSTLEARGAIRRATNNNAAYRCCAGTDECAAVAEELGFDLFKFLPS